MTAFMYPAYPLRDLVAGLRHHVGQRTAAIVNHDGRGRFPVRVAQLDAPRLTLLRGQEDRGCTRTGCAANCDFERAINVDARRSQ